MKIRISDLIAPVYYDIWNNKHNYSNIILKGGRSSAKGTLAYTTVIIDGILKKKTDAFVYAPTSSSIEKGVLSQIDKTLERIGLVEVYDKKQSELSDIEYRIIKSPYKIIFKHSTIFFVSLDAINMKKANELFNGVDSKRGIGYVVFDEMTANEDPKLRDRIEALNKTFGRQRFFVDGKEYTTTKFFIFNPPANKNHWIFDFIEKFKDHKNTIIKHTTIFDLPKHYFHENLFKEIELDKEKDYKKFLHEWMGEAVGVDGLAFPNLNDEDVLLDEIDLNIYKEYYISTDNGIGDSTSWTLYGLTKHQLPEVHAIDTFYHSSRSSDIIYSESEFAEIFKKELIGYQQTLNSEIKDILADSLNFVIELRNVGIEAVTSAKAKAKKKELGYNVVTKMINQKRLKILNTQNNMILLNQAKNAERTYKDGKYTVKRPSDNERIPESRQLHSFDTLEYILVHLTNLNKI